MSADLAAARRSGRARGRSAARGRTRPTADAVHATPAPGPSSPTAFSTHQASGAPTLSSLPDAFAPSFTFSAPSLTVPDDGRRHELLRRLNQISQQRNLLERRALHGTASEPPSNGLSRASASQPSNHSDLLRKGADECARSVSTTDPGTKLGRTRRDSVRDNVELNGLHKRRDAFPKRRRGDAVVESSSAGKGLLAGKEPADGNSPRAYDIESKDQRVLLQMNGRPQQLLGGKSRVHSSSEKVDAMHIDLEAVSPTSNVEKVDLMIVDSNINKAAPSPTPPATSSAGPRGSGRVRTPSVLLSSHPGENLPSLQRSAASKNKQVAYCLRMVKDMLRLKDGFGFSKPIDQLWSVDQLPGYFELITHPMDLDTVRQKLESGRYLSTPGKEEVEEVVFDAKAFSVDMCLIFNNAQTYNRAGDIFYEAATRLMEKFKTKMKQMPTPEQLAAQVLKKNKKRKKGQSAIADTGRRNDSAKRRKANAAAGDGDGKVGQRPAGTKKKAAVAVGGKSRSTAATSNRKKKGTKPEAIERRDTESLSVPDMEIRLQALKRQRAVTEATSPASSPAAGGTSYMAQAQALYHVAMSYEEKVQLSENVSRLPPDKLSKIVALATKNKNSSMEVNNNEEIELDIDSMKNQTLREMEAYVNQALYRKKKGLPGNGPNADVFQMSNAQVVAEITKLNALLKKRTKGKSNADNEEDSKCKKERSFYDSESSSDSDESGSDSSGEDSSSEDSDSSGESDAELMRRRRERNLAHQQAMQAAGTPLPSPSFQNSRAS